MNRNLIPTSVRTYLKKMLYSMWNKSLKFAIKEQNLENLFSKLIEIVPDITHQYSNFEINTSYLNTKVRGLHAFQISIVNYIMKDIEDPVIVDIGDSSGTHLQYIAGLHINKKVRSLSINVDAKAVERIKKKGLEAIQAKAEDLQVCNVKADIFLCFETLEHLMSPCQFLYNLSTKTNAKYIVITVPYLKNSRVGLHHIRGKRKDYVNAENTHIFELNPQDWKLIVKHSGWNIVMEKIYLQYPRKNFFYFTKFLWRKFDFEGFYGLILKKDNYWSSRYADW